MHFSRRWAVATSNELSSAVSPHIARALNSLRLPERLAAFQSAGGWTRPHGACSFSSEAAAELSEACSRGSSLICNSWCNYVIKIPPIRANWIAFHYRAIKYSLVFCIRSSPQPNPITGIGRDNMREGLWQFILFQHGNIMHLLITACDHICHIIPVSWFAIRRL